MTEAEAKSAIGQRVSRETFERLLTYHDELVKWQKAVNLVAKATLSHAWSRHFLDSLQVFEAAAPSEGTWLDLGSGGGFPGLVSAIVACERAPRLEFRLVDSDTRKCAFLREVARKVGVRVAISDIRVEDLPPCNATVVSARALAPLPQLLRWARPHLQHGGTCLFQKGASFRDELESAAKHWQMDVETLPSVTAADSVILRIRNLSHVE